MSKYQSKKLLSIIFNLLIFNLVIYSIGFAQQTNNLQVIWVKTGDTTFFGYGFLSKTSGDVNGDGYSDILYYGNERSWAGKCFLFYGGNSIDTIPNAIFSNQNGFDALCMGDFNGDGYDDIAIGNVLEFEGFGGVYIYLGGVTIDTTCDYTIMGPHAGSIYGFGVSSGDVNGDRFDCWSVWRRPYAWRD